MKKQIKPNDSQYEASSLNAIVSYKTVTIPSTSNAKWTIKLIIWSNQESNIFIKAKITHEKQISTKNTIELYIAEK